MKGYPELCTSKAEPATARCCRQFDRRRSYRGRVVSHYRTRRSQFTFDNAARLHTALNPEFFKGTIVEGAVAKLA